MPWDLSLFLCDIDLYMSDSNIFVPSEHFGHSTRTTLKSTPIMNDWVVRLQCFCTTWGGGQVCTQKNGGSGGSRFGPNVKRLTSWANGGRQGLDPIPLDPYLPTRATANSSPVKWVSLVIYSIFPLSLINYPIYIWLFIYMELFI